MKDETKEQVGFLISDETFLEAVRVTPPRPHAGAWRSRGDVQKTLEAMLGFEIPEEVFLAKARELGQYPRKLEGCTDCTCRGDYHLPEECAERNCC